MSVHQCMPGAHAGQKRVLEPLELQLQAFVSHCGCLERNLMFFNYWAVSRSLIIFILKLSDGSKIWALSGSDSAACLSSWLGVFDSTPHLLSSPFRHFTECLLYVISSYYILSVIFKVKPEVYSYYVQEWLTCVSSWPLTIVGIWRWSIVDLGLSLRICLWWWILLTGQIMILDPFSAFSKSVSCTTARSLCGLGRFLLPCHKFAEDMLWVLLSF